jgi:hypothetical protein
MTQNRVPSPRVERYSAAVRDERQASTVITLIVLALLGACIVTLMAVASDVEVQLALNAAAQVRP